MTRPHDFQNTERSRRRLLRRELVATSVIAAGPVLWGRISHAASPRLAPPAGEIDRINNIPNLSGTLHEVTVDNDLHTRVRLPRGFSIRDVARTGQRPAASLDYVWHQDLEGGASLATPDGGWVYMSNAEVSNWRYGVGALRFDSGGALVDAYPICPSSSDNCAGGPTPWGIWLTSEGIDVGIVLDCDPPGRRAGISRPAVGVLKHEAAAFEPVRRHLYLTEDRPDGNFYRFTSDNYPAGGRPDLSSDTLEVAIADGDDPLATRSLRWASVPEPQPATDGLLLRAGAKPTRHQLEGTERFNGGAGCCHHNNIVYFTTKGDNRNRVWAVGCAASTIKLIYKKQSQQPPSIRTSTTWTI